MKKALLLLGLFFVKRDGYSQGYLCQRQYPIIKVSVVDTPFIRVFTTFLVNEKGETKEIAVQKVECSVCSDSLLNAASNEAIKHVQRTTFPKGVQNGKAAKVRYNLPVLFKYP